VADGAITVVTANTWALGGRSVLAPGTGGPGARVIGLDQAYRRRFPVKGRSVAACAIMREIFGAGDIGGWLARSVKPPIGVGRVVTTCAPRRASAICAAPRPSTNSDRRAQASDSAVRRRRRLHETRGGAGRGATPRDHERATQPISRGGPAVRRHSRRVHRRRLDGTVRRPDGIGGSRPASVHFSAGDPIRCKHTGNRGASPRRRCIADSRRAELRRK
jgi:hypothetical protein